MSKTQDHVLAVDPGKVSGWAIWTPNNVWPLPPSLEPDPELIDHLEGNARSLRGYRDAARAIIRETAPDSLPLPVTSGEAEFYDLLDDTEVWAQEVEGRGLIVAEAFTITMATLKKSRQAWSLEIIGCLRYLAEKYSLGFELQQVGSVKGLVTAEKLRALGLYRPTKGDHQNDALRHLVFALVRRGVITLSPTCDTLI